MDETPPISQALPLRDLTFFEVRPTEASENERWDALMREHHYLSFGWLAGESLRHVALLEGEWVALLGQGSAALSGRPSSDGLRSKSPGACPIWPTLSAI